MYVAISLVAIFAVISGVVAYSGSANVVVEGDYIAASGLEEVSLGAFSGPDVYADVNIYGTINTGGGSYLATTTDAKSYTVTFSDINSYAYIDVLNDDDEAALSWTLPATSTMMQILPEVGSSREWFIHHASTTSGTLTLVAGAGMDLVGVTANDDVIDGGEYTRLTCTQIQYRDADNENITCIVDELANVD